MMVQFSILPVSSEQHIGDAVAKAVKIVHESGLDYKLTPMGTLIKGEWKPVMDVIKKCHEAVREDFDRVMTQVKIDNVKDGDIDFDHKIKSVEEKAGVEFKK